MQVAAGGLPDWEEEKVYKTQKETHDHQGEVRGDYTLSELVKAYSHWVSF